MHRRNANSDKEKHHALEPARDASCYSAHEIEHWINTLNTGANPAAMRINIMARSFARLTGASGEDLKQEAFARLLERRRVIDRSIDLHIGFIGIMRSIASEEAVHRRRFQTDERISPAAEVMFMEAEPSPQDQALWRHYGLALIQTLEQEFSDRPILLGIFRKRLSELIGAQVEPGIPLRENERRAALKTLQRRLALFREAMI